MGWGDVNFEDGDHLVAGFPKFEGARLGENREIEMVKVYQITPDEFVPLVMTLPKKGRIHLIEVWGVWCWFQIDSVTVERLGTTMPSAICGKAGTERVRANTFFVKAVMKMSLASERSGSDVAPWELPPYNFRASLVPVETAVTSFYPVDGDAVFGNGAGMSLVPFELTNTAGVPLLCRGTRPLTRFAFSYNLENTPAVTAMMGELLCGWQGHCNGDAVLFAGMMFPPLTLMFESFDYQYCEQDFSYVTIANGSEVTVSGVYRFLKCDMALLADPTTHVKSYLNVGQHVLSGGGLQRLWCWTGDRGDLEYGTFRDSLGYTDAQEVTELMFLNSAGTGVNGFDSATGRMIPSYRRGVLREPYEFRALGLPERMPISRQVMSVEQGGD